MALTPYLGLAYFGGDVAGSLTDNGSQFTGSDRLLLDRVIKALATGDRHYGSSATGSTPATPTAAMATGGGLPGGSTYYYAVTLLDAHGTETSASASVAVSTPAVLDPPDSPDGQGAGGGNLDIGLYYYGLTALRDGEESPLSDAVAISTITGQGSITLTLPATAPTGAASYQVWRQEAGDAGYTRIAVVPVATTTYTDNGSVPANPAAGDPDQMPPASNSGVSIYQVTVTLAAADATKVTSGAAVSWRLYRTQVQGQWSSSSLVHQVVEPISDSNPALRTSWTDVGDDLVTSVPPLAASQLALSPYVLDHATALPSPAAYPDYYPVVVSGVLYAKISGAWAALGGTSGGTGGTTTIQSTSPVITATDGQRYRRRLAGPQFPPAASWVNTFEPGPPSPPQTVAADATTLSWTAPLTHDATGYRVYDQVNGVSTVMDLPSSTLTYSPPADDQDHALQVFAVNAVGTSLPSSIFDIDLTPPGGGGVDVG